MRKKIIILAAAVIVAATLVVGGTLAFFTDAGEVKNVVNIGDVKIQLTEPEFSELSLQSGDTYTFGEKVVPGDKIAKDPTVENIGSNPCYVRAKVKLTTTQNGEDLNNTVYLKDNPVTFSPEDFYQPNDGWKLNTSDGYYYCRTPLAPGDKVTLFKTDADGKTVEIPTKWGNEISGLQFSLSISAEAIQADNFTPATDGTNITGWKYSNGSEVSTAP